MKVGGGGGVVSGGAVKGTMGGGHLMLHRITLSDHCSEVFIFCSDSTGYILTCTQFGNNLD